MHKIIIIALIILLVTVLAFDFIIKHKNLNKLKILKADYWIDKLQLQQHPEGGYFREIYRSEESIDKKSLPGRYNDKRNFSTSIYFLLKGNDKSMFHKLNSDEIWNFYYGSSLTIFIIDKNGNLRQIKLGRNFESGEQFQFVIKKDQWFGAIVNDKSSYSLIGCTVSPGFDFNDFELGNRISLLKQYPGCKNIIELLTK